MFCTFCFVFLVVVISITFLCWGISWRDLHFRTTVVLFVKSWLFTAKSKHINDLIGLASLDAVWQQDSECWHLDESYQLEVISLDLHAIQAPPTAVKPNTLSKPVAHFHPPQRERIENRCEAHWWMKFEFWTSTRVVCVQLVIERGFTINGTAEGINCN